MTFTSFLQIECQWESTGPFLVETESLPWPDRWPQAGKRGKKDRQSPQNVRVCVGAHVVAPLPRAVLSKTQAKFTDPPVGPGELRQLLKSWTVTVPRLLLKERRGCDLNDPGFLSRSSGYQPLYAFWGRQPGGWSYAGHKEFSLAAISRTST